MGKKNRKGRAAAPAPPEAKARPRFPWWLAWGAFLLWPFWVFKHYYARFPFYPEALSPLFSLSQYTGSLHKVLPGQLLLLAGAVLFLFACYGLGRPPLRRLGFSFQGALEEAVFSVGAGFGLLSALMLGLGLAGAVYPAAVAALLAAGLLAGAADLYLAPPAAGPGGPAGFGFLDKAALAALVLALLLGLLGALAPEIFYDALIYHLAVPNFYAIEHKITLFPFNAFSNLPMTHGMLYLAALSVGGVPLAKLVNYSAFLLTAGASYAFGARFLSRRAGLWGALVFTTVFHSMLSAWSAGTEMLLAFFTVLAMFAVILRGGTGEKKWFVLAGVFCGLAMGVKYTGLFTTIAAGAVFLYYVRSGLRDSVRELAWFSLAASFFIVPWLVKNWLHTANPFYPMLNGLFPPNEGSDPEKLKLFVGESRQMGALTPREWFLAPWRVTMGEVGNSELFSPLFLAFLPLLFLITPPLTAVNAALWLFFLVLWLSWSVSSTMVRFLIPAYPAAGLLLGWAFQSRGHETLKLLSRTAVLGVCLTGLFWSAQTFYAQGRWVPLAGKTTADEYLSRTQPGYPYSHYAAIRYVNENLPEDSRVLVIGDGRTLYFKRRFLAGTAFDKTPVVEFARASADGRALYERLKKEGVTHLLVNTVEGMRLAREYGMFAFDDRSLAVFGDFWDSHVRELYAYDEENEGRVMNRVAVYELSPAAADPPPRNLVAGIVASAKGAGNAR
ncbi:MAG TPA: phospholipid carrier-dependent glycosyltransferase [Elusimicrobiales bacterium]|nr:phospholipid carrier-dependent glycosyltransferase [Elusimicrobiales bacterium]